MKESNFLSIHIGKPSFGMLPFQVFCLAIVNEYVLNLCGNRDYLGIAMYMELMHRSLILLLA